MPEELASHTDAHLENLRDYLALRQSRLLRSVGLLIVAFGAVSILALSRVPFEAFMAAIIVFLLLCSVLLWRSLQLWADRGEVVRELEARSVQAAVVVSPATGRSSSRAVAVTSTELDHATLRRLRLPSMGSVVSLALLIGITMIKDASDGAWLDYLFVVLVASLGVSVVWWLLILVSVGKIRR